MKKNTLLTKFLLLTSLCFSAVLTVSAQKIAALPSGLTEKSSLEEIFKWLGENGLSQVIIGLESNASGTEPNAVPTSGTRYYELAFFSKGFRLAKIDGCRVTLRNDNIELLRFETKYPNSSEGSLDEYRKIQNKQSKFIGEFSLPLRHLKANKSPFSYTKKVEQMNLLGTWRTEFKMKYDFFLIPSREKLKSLMENRMKIEIVGARPDGKNDSMNGDEITFTFDEKQTSENFYAVFSRAITLCKDK